MGAWAGAAQLRISRPPRPHPSGAGRPAFRPPNFGSPPAPTLRFPPMVPGGAGPEMADEKRPTPPPPLVPSEEIFPARVAPQKSLFPGADPPWCPLRTTLPPPLFSRGLPPPGRFPPAPLRTPLIPFTTKAPPNAAAPPPRVSPWQKPALGPHWAPPDFIAGLWTATSGCHPGAPPCPHSSRPSEGPRMWPIPPIPGPLPFAFPLAAGIPPSHRRTGVTSELFLWSPPYAGWRLRPGAREAQGERPAPGVRFPGLSPGFLKPPPIAADSRLRTGPPNHAPPIPGGPPGAACGPPFARPPARPGKPCRCPEAPRAFPALGDSVAPPLGAPGWARRGRPGPQSPRHDPRLNPSPAPPWSESPACRGPTPRLGALQLSTGGGAPGDHLGPVPFGRPSAGPEFPPEPVFPANGL